MTWKRTRDTFYVIEVRCACTAPYVTARQFIRTKTKCDKCGAWVSPVAWRLLMRLQAEDKADALKRYEQRKATAGVVG